MSGIFSRNCLQAETKSADLVELISTPLVRSLFDIHPNQLVANVQSTSQDSRSYEISADWICWWDWATLQPNQWMKLVALNSFYQDVLIDQSNAGVHSNDTPVDSVEIPGDNRIQIGDIPLKLRQIIWDCNRLSFPRKVEPEALCKHCGNPCSHSVVSKKGMSPKKHHEVTHFASCIAGVVQDFSSLLSIKVRHVVDVGAGQGYLSRSLRDLPLHTHDDEKVQHKNLHILAVDSSVKQTVGAESRSNAYYKLKFEESSRLESVSSCESGSGSLTHRTLLVHRGREDEVDELERAINEWLKDIKMQTNEIGKKQISPNFEVRTNTEERESIVEPTPVLFVALHACGSLTPTVLRSVMSYMSTFKSDTSSTIKTTSRSRMWYAVGCIVVGCCYNLLDSEDFPLSLHVSELLPVYPKLLTPSHLQIAAQVPSQWFRSRETMLSASLAIRKVVYRALVEPRIKFLTVETLVDGARMQKSRIGKLNDKSYESYEIFLEAAGDKLGYELKNAAYSNFTGDVQDVSDDVDKLISRLEVFHVLRCLLGPAIETLILLDRYLWLKDSLRIKKGPSNVVTLGEASMNKGIPLTQRDMDFDVKLINIFDQGLDSGRNVAIMLLPDSILSYR